MAIIKRNNRGQSYELVEVIEAIDESTVPADTIQKQLRWDFDISTVPYFSISDFRYFMQRLSVGRVYIYHWYLIGTRGGPRRPSVGVQVHHINPSARQFFIQLV